MSELISAPHNHRGLARQANGFNQEGLCLIRRASTMNYTAI